MRNRSFSMTLITAGVSLMALGGCTSIHHPNSMPTGYTYLHDTYKSPPPPPSSKISYEQRQHMDALQAEQFRDSVYDLLQRLSARAGLPPKPVYVLTPSSMTPFYVNFDNDLRESMRSMGYALSDTPSGAYVFAYDAEVIERPRGQESMGGPNVQLYLRVFDTVGEEARMLTEETGHYYIKGAETLDVPKAKYSQTSYKDTVVKQDQGFYSAYQDDSTYESGYASSAVDMPVQAIEIESEDAGIKDLEPETGSMAPLPKL
jgi:hypothetical protein